MFSDVFLAATAAELAQFRPKRAAYMACHFSPYGTGLSNLPCFLPPESMLLLDDSMPPGDHDPSLVAEQLTEIINKFSVKAVLLDFQREKNENTVQMSSFLIRALPCPVAAAEPYAMEIGCPVLLSPVPANVCLQAYLAPWLQQGVYMEIAPAALQITVAESGSSAISFEFADEPPLYSKKICCHYDVKVASDKAVFTLTRTKDDLAALVQQATAMGVHGMVGLYQELTRL